MRVAVTMRTPGHDFELAAGFLCTEGLVAPGGIDRVSYCANPDAQQYNVVSVRTREPFDLGAGERNFFATSSCGICGKAALEAVRVRCNALDPAAGPVIATGVLRDLPGSLRDAQDVFERTGGLHAAGLFDASGRLVVLREDVGRHNAVDAVVGARALGTVPEDGEVLLVSGRLSFEIVQKAAVAGIPILAAISAPSSLAVDTAEELGITTVGFLRPGGFNVYTHPRRVTGIG
jgi:FdhD protein